MSYGRCVACHEDGVKRPFGKVCIYCGTNQKKFRQQEQAEFRESYDAAAENAGKYKWVSIPIGIGAAVLSFVLSLLCLVSFSCHCLVFVFVLSFCLLTLYQRFVCLAFGLC